MHRPHLVLILALILVSTGCLRQAPPPPPPRQPLAAPPVALPNAPEPARPAVPNKPVDDAWYLPRSSWAAGPISVGLTEPLGTPWRITVHHSGEPGDAKGEPKELLRTFERAHQGRGWACIGYHFIIARDGRVFEGRPIRFQGAHAGGDNNEGNIGICLIGDYDIGQVPRAQREALTDVLDRLTRVYRVSRSNVYGHRNFKTTDCPGRYLMPIVDAFRAGR